VTARAVTISASFGTGGSAIGPAVAERLGLPFLDRAIPVAVAASLAVPLDQALAHYERPPSLIGRIIASMASASLPFGVSPPAGDVVDDQAFRTQTEEIIRSTATSGGCVVLGRAAACILNKEPWALHVRLDGPRPARLAQAVAQYGADPDTVAKQLDETDRARELYVRHFYKADPHDPRLYHLVIDATAFGLETCLDLIEKAAAALPDDGSPADPPARAG
jgi:cytidylate kinase